MDCTLCYVIMTIIILMTTIKVMRCKPNQIKEKQKDEYIMWCNNFSTQYYISVLKFLQVSVKSNTHFKSVIALYKSVLFLSSAI